MRTRTMKFICALMACAMLFTAAITVNADEILTTTSAAFCGEKVTWAVADGVLTISGEGPMNSYTASKAPWAGETYTSVVINDGVASIGNYAFAGSAITSVTIPASVRDIGVGAFRDCTALTKVAIPANVTEIRNLTFAGCTKLNSVTLSANTARIGNMAFEGCSALAAISLPATVNYIGSGAFNESGLTTITIPEGVEDLPFKAFGYCAALTKATIASSVKTIDADAFTGSTKLTITAAANSNAHAFATANNIKFTQSGSVKVDDDNYAWDNPFTDVDETAWYYDGVKYVNVNGIMVGTATDKFSPLLSLTRAQFVTILYRIEGEPAVGSSKFADVPKGSWYDKAVAWAAENGITQGTSATKFDPNATLNNEQLATMTYRYAQYKKYATETEGELTYSDKKIVSSWAVEAVLWADNYGIMTGNLDGTFGPTKDATRGQAADVFAKFMLEFK